MTIPADVLYYPHIEFMSDTWVKSALCVWDHVYRVVPVGYSPRDSDDILRAVDADLVRNISLAQSDVQEAGIGLEQFFSKVPFPPAGLQTNVPRSVRLHHDKIDSRVLPLLESLAAKVDPDGFLHLSPEVVNTYMLFLCSTVATQRGLYRLTDSDDMFSIMQYFAHQGNFKESLGDSDAEEFAAVTVLPTLLPGGLDYAPMEKVIEFRKQTFESRAKFRASVVSLTSELVHIKDARYAKQRLIDFATQARENDRTLLQIIKDEPYYALLGIGMPVATEVLRTLMRNPDVVQWKQIAGSVFVGGVASLANAALVRRQSWGASEATYYLGLGRVFRNGPDLELRIPNVNYLLDEFVND